MEGTDGHSGDSPPNSRGGEGARGRAVNNGEPHGLMENHRGKLMVKVSGSGFKERHCVLDMQVGVISYYQSASKASNNQRKGCVNLRNAIIDQEDALQFAVSEEGGKVYKFRAASKAEKSVWTEKIKTCIFNHSMINLTRWTSKAAGHKPGTASAMMREMGVYKSRLEDALRQLHSALQNPVLSKGEKMHLDKVYRQTTEFLALVTTSISDLSRCKEQAVKEREAARSRGMADMDEENDSEKEFMDEFIEWDNQMSRQSIAPTVYYDCDDFSGRGSAVTRGQGKRHQQVLIHDESVDMHEAVNEIAVSSENEADRPQESSSQHSSSCEDHLGVPGCMVDNEYEIYEDDDEEDDIDPNAFNGLAKQMMGNIKLGSDMSKTAMPVHILEKRSFLEVFADFFANCDQFLGYPHLTVADDPAKRMVQVLTWYISSFKSGWKPTPTKPYNPILGETFQCYFSTKPDGSVAPSPNISYDMDTPRMSDRSMELRTDAPVPWAAATDVIFVAEQVSHHPPISAFYCESEDMRVQATGHFWIKSTFQGLSIACMFLGEIRLKLLDYNETYRITFPTGWGRNVLGKPWSELGGDAKIECAESKYMCPVTWHTKSKLNSKTFNMVTAKVLDPHGDKVASVSGYWDESVKIQYGVEDKKNPKAKGTEIELYNAETMRILKKRVRPISKQDGSESRKVWEPLTSALAVKDYEAASAAKQTIENEQRVQAKLREENGEKWALKLFELYRQDKQLNYYKFNNDLEKRLRK